MNNLLLNIYLLIGLYVAAAKRPTGSLWLAKLAAVALLWPLVMLYELLQQNGK